MRRTRTEPYTVEMFRSVTVMVCNNCGAAEDLELGASVPEGWYSLAHREQGKTYTSFHFDDYECFYGFVTAHEEGLPSKLQIDLEQSIDQINQQRAEKEADKILAGAEA